MFANGAALIIVRLVGGLGNQMFQYAAGRALALRRGVELLLDVRAYANNPKRRYSLQHFALAAAFASADQLRRATAPGWLERVADTLCGRPRVYYREQAFTFDPAVLRLPDRTYLAGFWQSEQYFVDAAAAIRRELAPPDAGAAADAIWLERIRGSCSVSLHVRRGDYASEPAKAAYHGTCAPDYYARAARAAADMLGCEPHFFVFSDEPDWAASNLDLQWPHSFVVCDDGNADRDIREFRLMSACRHHITANSSFSWWAAWLGSDPDKIVIAPKQWFASPTMNDRDLIPPGWRRL